MSQMTLNKMYVFLTASLVCSVAAIFHEPSSFFPVAEPQTGFGFGPRPGQNK